MEGKDSDQKDYIAETEFECLDMRRDMVIARWENAALVDGAETDLDYVIFIATEVPQEAGISSEDMLWYVLGNIRVIFIAAGFLHMFLLR